MQRTAVILPVLGLLVALLCGPASGEGLSREQGDAMINELRQIRLLLEKQQKGEAAPPAPAPPAKVRLKLGKEYSIGRSDAPLVMVEYTDYQCAFCNRFFTTTYPELKKRYIDTGKLRFISRDYPLEFHPHAMKAAQANRCAGEQDKFWQLKDALMSNSARLTPELIASLARSDANLDMAKFRACVDSGKYLDEIKAGIGSASALGINGTPSFIIGTMDGDTLDGTLLVGAQPFASFDGILRQLQPGPRR